MRKDSKTTKEKKPRQSLKRVVSNNVYLLKMVWRYAPGFIFAMFFVGVVWGVGGSVANVWFLKLIFDRLGSGAALWDIMRPLIIWIAYEIGFWLSTDWFYTYYFAKLNYTLNYKINADLFAKARTLDLACYDDPDFYNEFVWAMNESASRSSEVVGDLNRLISTLLGSAATIAMLFTIDKWLALTIIGFTSARWFIQRRQFKLYHKRQEAMNPLNRRRDYYSRVFYMAEYAKEMRMTDIGDRALEDYTENSDNIKKTYKKFGLRLFPTNTTSMLLYVLCDAAVMLLMTYELMVTKSIQLGGFAAAVNATWQLSWRIRALTNILIKFPEHSLYTEKIRKFNSTEPAVVSGDTDVPEFEELDLSGVSFSYLPVEKKTNAEERPDVLRDIDVTIRRGEKVAFVGYNGAGKTTLIKLLMRLYDPTRGEIRYNGRDVREYKLEDYRSRIGALFQDYKIFAATLAENVLGDVYDESKREQVLEALRHADFDGKLAEFADGLDTNLTREYDDHGVNLSGGEQQKVAISRVFANDHDILIMDEPSSALDPDAEYRLNRSIIDFAKEKTVIFISHRLSTTRMADRIYMFEDGRVVESGTHDELMTLNGKYAYMFNLQAEKYLE